MIQKGRIPSLVRRVTVLVLYGSTAATSCVSVSLKKNCPVLNGSCISELVGYFIWTTYCIARPAMKVPFSATDPFSYTVIGEAINTSI